MPGLFEFFAGGGWWTFVGLRGVGMVASCGEVLGGVEWEGGEADHGFSLVD